MKAPLSDNPIGGQFSAPQMVKVSEVHGQGTQELIIIPVDKITLMLYEHSDSLDSRRAFLTPLGIGLTILTALLTASFRDFYLTAAVWQAIFIISFICSVVWFAVSVFKYTRSISIRGLVDRIKTHDKQP